MVAYALHYIVDAVDTNIMGYVIDFTLERELEKLLDKLTLKVSRSVIAASGFEGFNPDVELLLKFNTVGIFRGRVKTSSLKEYYEIEVYSCAEILGRTLAQKIYENKSPEYIFTDLINTYTDLTPVTATSDTILQRFVADEYISSIISQLAQALGWSIYTDFEKNIYFQSRGTNTNGTTIRRQAANSNAIFGQWKKDYNELCNDIRVTGDNVGYDTVETFTGDGTTTTFSLNQQPTIVKITLDGTEIDPGLYQVDAEVKKINFNNPPANAVVIIVYYTYTYQIYVARENAESINSHTRFSKYYFHKWLKTRNDVIVYCNNYLTTYKSPLLENTISMNAAYITTFTPGEQVLVIDDLEGYNQFCIINKIKLKYLKSSVELNIGSYIPSFITLQSSTQDRVKELEKNLSKNNIQLSYYNSEAITLIETFDESSEDYINFKIAADNPPKCEYGRGTLNDARVGLCQC